MTVGQTVSEFFEYLEQQEKSNDVLTVYSGAIRRHFLWQVFCLLPASDYPIVYTSKQVLDNKIEATTVRYRRCWERFNSFLESAPVKYLTMGDAVRGFLHALKNAGYAEQTVLNTRSCIKQLGRDYARGLPMDD